MLVSNLESFILNEQIESNKQSAHLKGKELQTIKKLLQTNDQYNNELDQYNPKVILEEAGQIQSEFLSGYIKTIIQKQLEDELIYKIFTYLVRWEMSTNSNKQDKQINTLNEFKVLLNQNISLNLKPKEFHFNREELNIILNVLLQLYHGGIEDSSQIQIAKIAFWLESIIDNNFMTLQLHEDLQKTLKSLRKLVLQYQSFQLQVQQIQNLKQLKLMDEQTRGVDNNKKSNCVHSVTHFYF